MYRDDRRVRLLLALLIVTSFTLITLDYRSEGGGPLRGLRRAASSVFGPVERAVSSVVRPIGNALATLGDLGGLHDEVRRLRRENTQLAQTVRENEDVRRENAEFTRLLGLAGRGGYRILVARVVAVGPDNFAWTATLDVGSRDGIRAGMTVVNGDGLVGRILDENLGPFTAQVLLAIDPQFTVFARMATSGEVGGVTGAGLKPMRLELNEPEAKVTTDEPVVSRGLQGGIVPGVPIGVAVTSGRERIAPTRTVAIRPYVRFTRLDIVGVVVAPPRADPRNAVLPPPPPQRTPTASPSPSPTPSPSPSPSPSPTPSPA